MSLELCHADALEPALAANDEAAARLSSAPGARRRQNDIPSRFDVYRADRVGLTSVLFGGGDWHWRLTGASGAVIADCGGYRNEAQCLAAVSALRVEAGLAIICTEPDTDLLPSEPRRGPLPCL